MGPVQLTFLQLLHSKATQQFTYLCSKSAAWSNGQVYTDAITFMGYNEQEFGHGSKVGPTVSVQDGCRVRPAIAITPSRQHPVPIFYAVLMIFEQKRSDQGKSVFQFKTKKPSQLPITDFLPQDYGGPGQAFGFEVGPVCFAWLLVCSICGHNVHNTAIKVKSQIKLESNFYNCKHFVRKPFSNKNNCQRCGYKHFHVVTFQHSASTLSFYFSTYCYHWDHECQ